MNPRIWYRASDDQYIVLGEDIERPVLHAVVGCLRAFCIACVAYEIVAVAWGLP